MSRKKASILVLFLLVVLVPVFWHHRLEVQLQQERLQLLTSTLAKVSSEIRPGTRRDQVETTLKADGLSFYIIFTKGHSWDYILLGRRPSGEWYCGPIQFGVAIDFGEVATVTTQASDTAFGVSSYELADNCL